MLKICKNMWLERSASERALNEGSPSVVFSLKFCHTSPLQSLGCVRRKMRKKKQFFWQYFVIFHEIKSKFMHRKRSFWKVLHVRQLLPTILTLTSWTALVHICTTLSDFVRKELSPKSDEDQFSPHNVNTFSKEMVMRFIKWSPQGKYFDLLSNSLN